MFGFRNVRCWQGPVSHTHDDKLQAEAQSSSVETIRADAVACACGLWYFAIFSTASLVWHEKRLAPNRHLTRARWN